MVQSQITVRTVESRIGELLGPGEPTNVPSECSDGINKHLRHEFRRLAWWKDA